MARFSDLADEIVLGIWPYIHPSAVESFALTNRKIYSLGSKSITVHNRLSKLYKVVTNEPTGYGKIMRTDLLIKTIVDIIRDPRIAHYVRAIHIDTCMDSFGLVPTLEDDLERFRETRANLDVISHLLEDCEFVEHREVIYWWSNIKQGNEDPLLGLLLYILPNIRVIRFEPYIYEPTLALELITRIAREGSHPALSKLRELAVEPDQPSGIEDLAVLTTFALLSSVNKLTGKYVSNKDISDSTFRIKKPLFLPKASNVRSVELIESNLPGNIFDHFISIFKSLLSFTYTPCRIYIRTPETTTHSFDPFAIRNTLAFHSGLTLKELTLLACTRKRQYMGTLHSFKSLTHLITDWRLLLPPCPVDKTKLAKALPPSIVEVTLHLDYRFNGRQAKKMIENLCTYKAWDHPNLQIIRFCHLPDTAMHTFLEDDFVKTAKAAGLMLELHTDPGRFSSGDARCDITLLLLFGRSLSIT